MIQDVRYALRMMKKNPVLTFIIIMTLALGSGANVAIFTAINAVLLQSPAVSSPDRLVMVWDALPKLGERRLPITAAEYVNYSRNAKSVDMVAGFTTQAVTLTGSQAPERVTCARVSASLFPLLGATPSIGRAISTEEDQTNSARGDSVGRIMAQKISC
jgi:putative ABC transport system permease protein